MELNIGVCETYDAGIGVVAFRPNTNLLSNFFLCAQLP